MQEKAAIRLADRQDDHPAGSAIPVAPAGEELDLNRQGLDPLTHARLWKNPCGFAALFNYLALRYNVPLNGWVKELFDLSRVEFVVIYNLGVDGPFTASEIAPRLPFRRTRSAAP